MEVSQTFLFLVKRKTSSKIAEWHRTGGRGKEVKSQDGIHTIKTI